MIRDSEERRQHEPAYWEGENDSEQNKTEKVAAIRRQFPNHVPVVVEKFSKEVNLPNLDRPRFLIPQTITMSQFMTVLRNRMKLGTTEAFFVLVNNQAMPSLSKTMAEIYAEHKSDDGFLYATYASQEVFG